jgi:diguanylate cyclase (GGDEF)-like protein
VRPAGRASRRYATNAQSTAATAVSLLYSFGGVACLLGAQFPMGQQIAVGLSQFIGIFALCVAAPLFVLRHRLSAVPLNAALATSTVLASALVASTGAAVGVVLPGVYYMCIALTAAYFFPSPQARAQACLAAGGFSAGVLASGVHGLFVPWFVITAAILAMAELLRHLVTQLHEQAALDPLTGLANRACFRFAAEREFALAGRSRTQFSVALLDLDGFKAVNDTYGHAAGDELLTELAAAWQAQIRGADLLARYGGDEFALIMPETGPDEAAQVVERLRTAHSAQWSAGVVTWDDETELNQLLQRADEDLYRAKNARAR